jgi:hypothetical protein
MSCPLSAPERLRRIAHALDRSTTDGCSNLVVGVVPDGDAAAHLVLRPVREHETPAELLAGFGAPADWWAIGLVAHSRTWMVDRLDLPPMPSIVTFLIERDGDEVTLLRQGHGSVELPGPSEGRIPELCRLALGLPGRRPGLGGGSELAVS